MPIRRLRRAIAHKGLARDTLLATGGGVGTLAWFAQVAGGSTVEPTHLDALVKLATGLGSTGCLTLLAWSLYQRCEAHGRDLVEAKEAHGQALMAAAERYAVELAAERARRLEEAADFGSQVATLQAEAAAERARLLDATILKAQRPTKAPAASKKGKGK